MADVEGSTTSTPILDSGVLPLRTHKIRPQALLAAALSGAILMEALAMAGGLWHEHWPIVFLLLLFLAVAIHELGHLLAGWIGGFHFSSIQVGPILLSEEYGLIRTRVSFDMIALGYTGMYADTVRKLRWRLSIYVAGGPCANLLSFAVVALMGNLIPHTESGLATAIGQFGAISLVLALISLAPIATNDGGLIETLLCSPLSARQFLSVVALGAQFNQGVRARDWKQTWIKAATDVPGQSRNDFYANWMAYISASDRQDARLSAQYLERCLSLTPQLTGHIRGLVAQEAFIHCAWFKCNPNLANKWLSQIRKRGSLAPIVQARIEVALCCVRSDFDSAEVACEKGLDLFQRMPMKPYIRAMQESWIEWQTEIKSKKEQLVIT